MNQRGFVLVEFVIALPLLIFLLYALSTLTLRTAKIAREQVADYALETEAQEVIDRISDDARVAYSVEIKQYFDLEEIIFICHSISGKNKSKPPDKNNFYDKLDRRMYRALGKMYFNHKDDPTPNNPLTGDNSFGNTLVTDFKFSRDFLPKKVLHITLEMQSEVTKQKVKFSTAVYMPACEKIIYHGEKIL